MQANVGNYMSHAAPAQDETEDRYYTQVDDGDVRLFTLDQLDAAFNAGLIHENTYVCLEGSSEWLTLATVAGLEDSEEEAPVPQSVAPAPVYVAPAPAPMSAAPIASPFAPSISVAPVAARPAGAAYASVPAPYSVAPVVNDLSFDDDDMLTMRPKRRLGKVLAGVAVLGLAAAGIAVAQSGGLALPKLKLDDNAARASAASLTLSSLKEQSQPVAKAPEAAAPAPVKEEAKAAETAAPSDKAESDSGAKKSDDRFTEDMKAALLAKDKKQTVDQKHKKAARVAVATSTRKASGKSSGGGFKNSGSAYDPLNGKL